MKFGRSVFHPEIEHLDQAILNHTSINHFLDLLIMYNTDNLYRLIISAATHVCSNQSNQPTDPELPTLLPVFRSDYCPCRTLVQVSFVGKYQFGGIIFYRFVGIGP